MFAHSKAPILLLFAGTVIGIGTAVVSGKQILAYCADIAPVVGYVSQTDGVPRTILVTPFMSKMGVPGEARIIDERGRTRHVWHTDKPLLTAHLLSSGSLFAMLIAEPGSAPYPGGGKTGIIQELSWNGTLVWEYKDPAMHHDFDVLPDGSIAYIQWEQAPETFATRVRGGQRSDEAAVWTDAIVVVNRAKEVIWEWHMYEHLDPAKYELNAFTPRRDWGHSNSIRYTAANPITGTPAFLLSVRHISRVLLIDAKSGAVLWESPDGVLAMQHDATFVPGGNILVFDNGLFRVQNRANFWSRIVELDPVTDAVYWTYDAGETATEHALLATSIMGGAQRLDNGNTLITVSTMGRIQEVTPGGKVMWDFFSSFTHEGDSRIAFRARAYDIDPSRIALPVVARVVCR